MGREEARPIIQEFRVQKEIELSQTVGCLCVRSYRKSLSLIPFMSRKIMNLQTFKEIRFEYKLSNLLFL